MQDHQDSKFAELSCEIKTDLRIWGGEICIRVRVPGSGFMVNGKGELGIGVYEMSCL